MSRNTEANLVKLATEYRGEVVKRDNAETYRLHLRQKLTDMMVAMDLERFETPSGQILIMMYAQGTPEDQPKVPRYVLVKEPD